MRETFRLFGDLASLGVEAEQKEIAIFEASISAAAIQAFSQGIRLSKVNQLLGGLDSVVLFGKLQQNGISLELHMIWGRIRWLL
jgi:hypothetical protein